MAAGEEPAAGLVAPGDWPDDPAGPDTPVAHSASEVSQLASGAATRSDDRTEAPRFSRKAAEQEATPSPGTKATAEQ